MMHRNKSPGTKRNTVMNPQVEKYIAPVNELNALAIDNIEKLISLNVKRFEETAKAGIEQLRAAAAIKDVEDVKAYLNSYAETIRQIGERTVEDTRAVLEMGNSYTSEAQRIFKDALKTN